MIVLAALSRRFGGADQRVLQVARALEAASQPYTVAVLAGSGLHRRLRQEGLHATSFDRKRGDPRLLVDLARLSRSARVVDAHNPQSQFWALAAGRLVGVPNLIATVHSVYGETHPTFVRRHIHESSLHLAKLVGARFVAVSGTVYRYLQSLGVSEAACTLSPNGIEAGPRAPLCSDIRVEANWRNDVMVVSIIGRLEPVKGHANLFRALARVEPTAPHLRVLVVGEGRSEPQLVALVDSLGLRDKVYFTGFRRDIDALLAETDIICMPSLSEGLPYTLLEAARAGVPILASAVGGIAETFKHDLTALLVPPTDEYALAEALAYVARRPHHLRQIAYSAKKMIDEQYSVDRMIRETLSVYDRPSRVTANRTESEQCETSASAATGCSSGGGIGR